MSKLIFLSFLIWLTGCVKSNPDQIQIVNRDAASQLALWKKKSISNYEMTMKISCYCIQGRVGPHNIIVENEYILNQWITKDNTDEQWSRKGAEDAVEYYNSVNGDFTELKKSYDWVWLASYALLKRNLIPNQ